MGIALVIQVVGMFAYIVLADIQHALDEKEERFDLRMNILLSLLWWAFLAKVIVKTVNEKLLENIGED